MQKALKSNEWQRISVDKTFQIEIQKGRPDNSDFLQNILPPVIRFPLFNFKKVQDTEKSTPESCRMDYELSRIWVHKTFKIENGKVGGTK